MFRRYSTASTARSYRILVFSGSLFYYHFEAIWLSFILAYIYVKCLKDYEGTVLFVGINYDKKTKKHECRFETVEV